jgi:hypothetical protein
MKYIITEDRERFIGLSKLEVLLNLDSRPNHMLLKRMGLYFEKLLARKENGINYRI